MTAAALSTRDFRKAMGQFATGVTVVTVEREPGLVYGMTANAFTSVSLNPMLILICVDERSKMLPLLHSRKHFGISVLRDNQRELSKYFAQSEQNAAAENRLGVRFRWTSTGVPVLEETALQLSCTVASAHIAGDHTIFVARVEEAEIQGGEPLLFFQGEYRNIPRQ